MRHLSSQRLVVRAVSGCTKRDNAHAHIVREQRDEGDRIRPFACLVSYSISTFSDRNMS